MRVLAAMAVAAALSVATASRAAAQPVAFRGFAGAGSASDVNGQRILAFGGGALADLGQPWVSAGVQGEALTSNGYYAGRGALFGQVNPLGRSPVQPFVLGGFGFGEWAGPMIGGGLEVRPTHGRLGFRIAIEDYISTYERYGAGLERIGRETGHQMSVKFSVVF